MKIGRSHRALRRAHAFVLGSTLLTAEQVWGQSLIYDLRFDDGTHAKSAAAGTYNVELWTRVTGLDTNYTNDSLTSSNITILSSQYAGGGIALGGLAGGAGVAPFNDPLSYNAGTGTDLNADGLIDWGSTSTSIANTNYMFVRTPSGMFQAGGGAVGQAVNSNAWEFKIASFTLNANAIGAGVTTFNVVQPSALPAIFLITYAVARVDGALHAPTDRNALGAYASSLGITIGSGPAPIPPPPFGFDGGTGFFASAWNDAANWSVDPTTGVEHVPGGTDTALFDHRGIDSTVRLNFDAGTNNGPQNQIAGALVLSSQATRNITISNSGAGAGTITVPGVSGTIIANDAPGATHQLTIGGSTTPAIALAFPNGGEIRTASNITINSDISGNGPITKTGSATLTLLGASSMVGDINIVAGTVAVAADSALGDAVNAINFTGNGMLRAFHPGPPTAMTFGPRNVSISTGATATFSNAVSQTFTFSVSGGGTLKKVDAGSMTITGPCHPTGPIIVDQGTLNINTQSRATLVQASSVQSKINYINATLLGSKLSGSGSHRIPSGSDTTFNGVTLNATTLTVDGNVTGNITAGLSSSISGAGVVHGSTTIHNGNISPGGMRPAKLTTDSLRFSFVGGGTYTFHIADATGAAGVGTDTLLVLNSLNFEFANQRVTIDVRSLSLSTDGGSDPVYQEGPPLNFDNTLAYHWLLAHADGGITGFNSFVYRTAINFTAPTNGGKFSVSQSGNDLLLNFTPIPEPATLTMFAGGLALGVLRRRDRHRHTPSTAAAASATASA